MLTSKNSSFSPDVKIPIAYGNMLAVVPDGANTEARRHSYSLILVRWFNCDSWSWPQSKSLVISRPSRIDRCVDGRVAPLTDSSCLMAVMIKS